MISVLVLYPPDPNTASLLQPPSPTTTTVVRNLNLCGLPAALLPSLCFGMAVGSIRSAAPRLKKRDFVERLGDQEPPRITGLVMPNDQFSVILVHRQPRGTVPKTSLLFTKTHCPKNLPRLWLMYLNTQMRHQLKP